MPEHPASREMYDYIADWIAPDFAFGKKDYWHRFGMVGVWAEYVLSCTQGAILEIGTGESSIYLTKANEKHKRRIYHCDIAPAKITNPLSIKGVFAEPYTYFEERDPTPSRLEQCVLYAGSSDSLFKRFNIEPLALSFIDGDHLYEQVVKDFKNVAERTVANGYILLHDTYPADEGECAENRSGEVWRLRREIESDPRYDSITLPVGTAVNAGLTIVRVKLSNRPEFQQ